MAGWRSGAGEGGGGVMHYNRATDRGGGAVAMATELASGVVIHSSQL